MGKWESQDEQGYCWSRALRPWTPTTAVVELYFPSKDPLSTDRRGLLLKDSLYAHQGVEPVPFHGEISSCIFRYQQHPSLVTCLLSKAGLCHALSSIAVTDVFPAPASNHGEETPPGFAIEALRPVQIQ